MDNVICMEDIKLKNNINIDKGIDFLEGRNKEEFANVLKKVIDSGTSYIIKSLPINDNLKDIALDIKTAFKTKDFKEILKTAVNSSIKEGLELLRLPKSVLTDITKIGNIAFKGGIAQGISAGIDIISDKYLKNNIFYPIIDKVLDQVKNYITSSDFRNKISINIDKLLDKTNKFNELCDKWYSAYEKFDLFSMNNISKLLKKLQPHIVNDKDCLTQANIIENMTNLVTAKKDKLSPIQMQACSII